MLLSALQVLVGQKESQMSSQFQESPLLGIVPPRGLSTPRHTLSQALILCCLCSRLQSPGLFLSVPYASITPRFMEFEAEEVMQIQKLQWMQGVQGLPPPVPPKLDPQGSSAPRVRALFLVTRASGKGQAGSTLFLLLWALWRLLKH